MQAQDRISRLLSHLLEGPVGRELEEKAEAERAATRTRLRAELESGQAKYLAQVQQIEKQAADLDGRIKALKAQLEPLEKEQLGVLWKLGDKRGASTEHRDRLWRVLADVADPRVAKCRAEFEARLQACGGMRRNWVTGPARDQFSLPPGAHNQADVDRAAHYLIAAIDATAHWARTGLQGEEVERAYQAIMAKLPRIPMAKDDPGQIPAAKP